MKQFWTNFKHWLIKKLGGYVCPPVVTHQYEVVHHRVEPIAIYNTVDIFANTLERMDDADTVQKTVERQVAMAIANYIMYEKLYDVDQCYNPTLNMITYRTRVLVVPPNPKPTADDFNNSFIGRIKCYEN